MSGSLTSVRVWSATGGNAWFRVPSPTTGEDIWAIVAYLKRKHGNVSASDPAIGIRVEALFNSDLVPERSTDRAAGRGDDPWRTRDIPDAPVVLHKYMDDFTLRPTNAGGRAFLDTWWMVDEKDSQEALQWRNQWIQRRYSRDRAGWLAAVHTASASASY